MRDVSSIQDRRIQRTRQMLRDALITLIQEEPYENISIQEIADRANVNRVTFYLHFRDKRDLLLKSMEEIFQDLTSKVTPLNKEDLSLDVQPPSAVMMYRHIAENAAFYRVLLGEEGIPSFITQFRNYLANLTVERLRRYIEEDKIQVSLEIVSHSVAGSIIGMITWWLKNGMPISPEEMAHKTFLIMALGAYQAAGIEL